jgi:hypothetical protein
MCSHRPTGSCRPIPDPTAHTTSGNESSARCPAIRTIERLKCSAEAVCDVEDPEDLSELDAIGCRFNPPSYRSPLQSLSAGAGTNPRSQKMRLRNAPSSSSHLGALSQVGIVYLKPLTRGLGDLPVVTLPLRRGLTGMRRRAVSSMHPPRAQTLEPNCPAPAEHSHRHTST